MKENPFTKYEILDSASRKTFIQFITRISTSYSHSSCDYVEVFSVFGYIVDKFYTVPRHMVLHYFTLRALTHELNDFLSGSSISEVFSQQKNELVISLKNKKDRGGTTQFLIISVQPKQSYIFLREQFARAKKNSVDLFTVSIGREVSGLDIHTSDRLVQCMLDNGWVFYIQLYDTSSSNIFLADRNQTIHEAFKNNKELQGVPFTGDAKRIDERLFEDELFFREALTADSTQTLFTAFKHLVPVCGSTYTREVLHRARLEEKTPVASLQNDDIELLHNELHVLMKEAENPLPEIYYRGNVATVLSVIPLRHFAGSKKDSFRNVNEAVRTFIVKSFRESAVEGEKKALINNIKKALERSRRTIEAKKEEISHAARSEEYDRIGKVIMANLQHLTKGTTQIDLPDIFADERSIHIVLDPKLTPVRNAEHYFEKAKKKRLALIESERQIEKITSTVSLLEKLLLHLDNCQNLEQVKEFKKTYEKELSALGLLPQAEQEARIPFRVFTVAGGFEVWVGKSSSSNDELTMSYAKPNDLWFHVRGASGSHTVLKVAGNAAMPPKEAVREAASIAAYYSKMRNASNVPVAYCERKYVRKPKHAEAGTVTLQREKVIFVKPALP